MDDKRTWTTKKLREWLRSINLQTPKGILIAPLEDGDGHYVVTCPRAIDYAGTLVLAVRRAGGYAKIVWVDERINWASVEIDMFKSLPDHYANAQLSLRLFGDD